MYRNFKRKENTHIAIFGRQGALSPGVAGRYVRGCRRVAAVED
jgi:hypothetical protein